MKHGITKTDTTGSYDFGRFPFDIPAETPVVYGAPDCDGNPFREWTLPRRVAVELSGNAHDPIYYFLTIDADNVEEVEKP